MPRVGQITYTLNGNKGVAPIMYSGKRRSDREFFAVLPPEVAEHVEMTEVDGPSAFKVDRAFYQALKMYRDRVKIRTRMIGIRFKVGPWDQGWSGTDPQAIAFDFTLADRVTRPDTPPYYEIIDEDGTPLLNSFTGYGGKRESRRMEEGGPYKSAGKYKWVDYTPERVEAVKMIDTRFKKLGQDLAAFLLNVEELERFLDGGKSVQHALPSASDVMPPPLLEF